MKVAIVQHTPVFLNLNASVAKAVALIAEAGSQGSGGARTGGRIGDAPVPAVGGECRDPGRRRVGIAEAGGRSCVRHLAMDTKGHVSDVPVQDGR